jgi:hypothetical protein
VVVVVLVDELVAAVVALADNTPLEKDDVVAVVLLVAVDDNVNGDVDVDVAADVGVAVNAGTDVCADVVVWVVWVGTGGLVWWVMLVVSQGSEKEG